jgi:hypothetical protein
MVIREVILHDKSNVTRLFLIWHQYTSTTIDASGVFKPYSFHSLRRVLKTPYFYIHTVTPLA